MFPRHARFERRRDRYRGPVKLPLRGARNCRASCNVRLRLHAAVPLEGWGGCGAPGLPPGDRMLVTFRRRLGAPRGRSSGVVQRAFPPMRTPPGRPVTDPRPPRVVSRRPTRRADPSRRGPDPAVLNPAGKRAARRRLGPQRPEASPVRGSPGRDAVLPHVRPRRRFEAWYLRRLPVRRGQAEVCGRFGRREFRSRTISQAVVFAEGETRK